MKWGAVLFGILLILAMADDSRRVASYYADSYEGRVMANGHVFHQDRLWCASNDWPIGTRLSVRFGDDIVHVLVTDRMNFRFTGERIDLTKAAFLKLSPLSAGVIPVDVTVDN